MELVVSIWGCQVGLPNAWEGGGHEMESCCSHTCGPVMTEMRETASFKMSTSFKRVPLSKDHLPVGQGFAGLHPEGWALVHERFLLIYEFSL